VQIENSGDRATFRWLNEPDVVVRISGGVIQNCFYLKIEFSISGFEPRLLKIPGQIKRFRELVRHYLSRAKCSQCNMVVQREFTHVAGCMRQQHRFTERFPA
jgi:hypothetical protein